MPDHLSMNEVAELNRYESAIERGKRSFEEVGVAFSAIKEKRLYRSQYSTFEEYVPARWGMSARRVNQCILAARMLMANPEPLAGLSERAIRPLAGTSPEFQREVMQRVASIEPNAAKVTAAVVDRAKRETVALSLAAKTKPIAEDELKRLAAQERERETREKKRADAKAKRDRIRKHLTDWPAKLEREIEAALRARVDLREYNGLVRLFNRLRTALAGDG